MTKKKEPEAGRNKGKKYQKSLSLYPMKFEDAVKRLVGVSVDRPTRRKQKAKT